MLLELALLAIGLVLLVKGSDILVDSASDIALSKGISIGVVGLSVVAIGTSLPELVIGIESSLEGYGDVALGNVVGSNIANICLILGICVLIRPIIAAPGAFTEDIPVTMAAGSLLLLLSLDNVLSRADGMVLILATFIYFFWLFKKSSGEGLLKEKEEKQKIKFIKYIMIVIGIVLTLAGGKLTVDSAIMISKSLGIQPYLIAITVIAIGTNLPELATGIIASFKNKGDLALGNSLGSICVNTLLIMGICAIINPIIVPDQMDIIFALLSIILLLPLVIRGNILSRWEGIFLLIFYAIYLAYKIVLSPVAP
ncbi:hypothetical protein CUJ83_01520 [Methanocella sp. CWC-04]|uniref:Sodium/calcium exchanger membrane region domain-containing protein n=1 Tax=Methanooceanicella nereidis TaxID=2052831 RepID=A0AAP2RA08_9EURY|nr:calcium/sodium antiporter [Methanocella sp. CWC-04]MCD1293673.1 hypothetical protein [Methanocella sp. CWC-04]